ncbi:MAG: hypothetical protein NC453_13050 [Muribaculum sp.]|nr:hypothetical protein [Muribaculum sp.]
MEEKLTNSNIKSPSIIYLSILYLVAWCISPPLSLGILYRVIAVAAVGVLILKSNDNQYPDLKRRLNLTLFLIVYMAILCVITKDLFNRQIITYSILLVGVGFAIWNKRYGNATKQLEFIILFALILYCIWNTTTIMALIKLPSVMRRLTGSGGGVDSSYFLRGVGNFGYLYSVIVMLPIGIYQLIESKRKLTKLVALYFVVSAYIMTYMSQFFTALILSVLTIPMMAIAKRYQKGMNPIVIIFLIACLFFLFANLETILDFCIDIVDTRSLHMKLLSMKETLIYGNSFEDSEFGERYERYTRDLNIIITSPLWGALTFYAVGKHSCILDFFAQYGIIMGILYVRLLFKPCTDWTKHRMPMAYTVLWLSIILAFMNPFPLAAAAPLCIVLPSFCKLRWLESQ